MFAWFYALLLHICILHINATFAEINEINADQVCSTSDCQKLSKEMMSFMDNSVDPCVDFMEYACGGFKENFPGYDKYNDMNVAILGEMAGIYSGSLEYVQKFNMFYQSCLAHGMAAICLKETMMSFPDIGYVLYSMSFTPEEKYFTAQLFNVIAELYTTLVVLVNKSDNKLKRFIVNRRRSGPTVNFIDLNTKFSISFVTPAITDDLLSEYYRDLNITMNFLDNLSELKKHEQTNGPELAAKVKKMYQRYRVFLYDKDPVLNNDSNDIILTIGFMEHLLSNSMFSASSENVDALFTNLLIYQAMPILSHALLLILTRDIIEKEEKNEFLMNIAKEHNIIFPSDAEFDTSALMLILEMKLTDEVLGIGKFQNMAQLQGFESLTDPKQLLIIRAAQYKCWETFPEKRGQWESDIFAKLFGCSLNASAEL